MNGTIYIEPSTAVWSSRLAIFKLKHNGLVYKMEEFGSNLSEEQAIISFILACGICI